MKRLYTLLVLMALCTGSMAQKNCVTITGNTTNGKFRQALIGTAGDGADVSQPEIVAAAWTCYAQGHPACNMRSLLRYDVSSIPANAVILSARLFLYAKTNNLNGNPGNPTFGDNNMCLLQRVMTNWKDQTISWNKQPLVTTANQKILPQSTSQQQNYIVDITDFVQNWVQKPASNFGVLLRLRNETHYNSMVFNSGQASGSLQPKLEICYTLATPALPVAVAPKPAEAKHIKEKPVTAKPGTGPCSNSLIIKGNRTSGRFEQALIGTAGDGADVSQPEIVASAWSCYAAGHPSCNLRSLLRYDVSSLPTNAVITKARLYLYAKKNNINGYAAKPTYGDNNTALLQKVIAPWSIQHIGWSNRPAITTANQKILARSTSYQQNYEVDVTDFVQSWVQQPDKNFGMMLRLQTEDSYNSMVFNSGQAPDHLQPRLEICYATPAPVKRRGQSTPKKEATTTEEKVFQQVSPPPHNNTVTAPPVATAPGTATANKTLIIYGDPHTGLFRQLYLDSNGPNTADSSQSEMGAAAWTCQAVGFHDCNFRTLFRYELGNLPANAKINEAKLYLYAKTDNVYGYPGHPTYGENNVGLLQQITTPWGVSSTGWNNQPHTTTERQKQLPQSSFTAQNYVIDVTDFVQSWVQHPASNYGMLLRMQTEKFYNSLIFNSGQAETPLKPRLEISYSVE